MSLAWYRRRRLEGKPPRYVKISNRVFYRRSDLLEFIESRSVGADNSGRMK